MCACFQKEANKKWDLLLESTNSAPIDIHSMRPSQQIPDKS